MASQISKGLIGPKVHADCEPSAHLVRPPGSEWGFWRWVCLRGAGFPAAWPARISSPECAEHADRLAEAESRAHSLRQAAVSALKQELWDCDDKQKTALEKAIRRLKAGATADCVAYAQLSNVALKAFRAACSEVELLEADFQRSFDLATREISLALRDVAGDSLFREAVILQNRHALHTGLDPLLRAEVSVRGTKHRQHEQMVANYVQRYCLKNDTISFFGPVGWATLVTDGTSLAVRAGAGLVASRTFFFEGWCIYELAKMLSSSKEVLAWCAPKRSPSIYLDGAILHVPFMPPARLPEKQILVLRACDGVLPANQLAKKLCYAFPHLLPNEREIYRTLHILKMMGLIYWALDTPVSLRPEQSLRQAIELIKDDGLRISTMKNLDHLEEARRAVASAVGDPEKLDNALGSLNLTFTRLTNLASSRDAGKTYAGRTLLFDDCRRDIEVEIGPGVLRELEPPLSLMLTSARWFTVELASAFREAFKGIYRELVGRTGTSAVPAGNLVPYARKLFLSNDTEVLDPVIAAFQKRWQDVLRLPEGERCLNYSTAELRPMVEEAFSAPRPGWMFARYHSPDIMIAASSPEAVERGDYQLVLGELHMGTNTLAPALFVEQHPAPEQLMRAIRLDMPEPRLEPLFSHGMGLHSRNIIGLTKPNDYYLALLPGASVAPDSSYVPIGSMILEEVDNELVFRSRDGRLRLEIIEAMGGLMSSMTAPSFKLLAARPYTPRIVIDKLVVSREQWRFPAEELTFAFQKDEQSRFLAARRWARTCGLPRFVFVKTPIEVKPFYTDFSSPIYVEILAKSIRHSAQSGARIAFTEMLPLPNQLWLPDNEGRQYTSELRIITLDMASYS
jgi:hypothetical protein